MTQAIDQTFSLGPEQWFCSVAGRVFGVWTNKGAAEAGMQTEQDRERRRRAKGHDIAAKRQGLPPKAQATIVVGMEWHSTTPPRKMLNEIDNALIELYQRLAVTAVEVRMPGWIHTMLGALPMGFYGLRAGERPVTILRYLEQNNVYACQGMSVRFEALQ